MKKWRQENGDLSEACCAFQDMSASLEYTTASVCNGEKKNKRPIISIAHLLKAHKLFPSAPRSGTSIRSNQTLHCGSRPSLYELPLFKDPLLTCTPFFLLVSLTSPLAVLSKLVLTAGVVSENTLVWVMHLNKFKHMQVGEAARLIEYQGFF